jgi:hypothetical protein
MPSCWPRQPRTPPRSASSMNVTRTSSCCSCSAARAIPSSPPTRRRDLRRGAEKRKTLPARSSARDRVAAGDCAQRARDELASRASPGRGSKEVGDGTSRIRRRDAATHRGDRKRARLTRLRTTSSEQCISTARSAYPRPKITRPRTAARCPSGSSPSARSAGAAADLTGVTTDRLAV